MDFEFRYMRIYITENCNAKCSNCFNANSRSNNEISLPDFIDLCAYLAANGITQVKIMGGEPTVHKCFPEIISTAQKFFNRVTIFTNGIFADKLNLLHLRANDAIVYNFNFSKAYKKETLLLSQPGYRSLEVQIKSTTNTEVLKHELLKVFNLKEDRTFGISFTLDCTSNILKEKAILIPKIMELCNFATEQNFPFSFDHAMPFCFLYNSGLKIGDNCFCKLYDTGLIDAALNLRMCNQFSSKLIKIKTREGFVPWQIICNYIKLAYYENQVRCLNKICLNCIYYDKVCNGGCWIGKDEIATNDILHYSGFPVKKN